MQGTMMKWGAILLIVALIGVALPLSGVAAFAGTPSSMVALQGPVSSMPDEGYVGQWMVGGVPVQVDEDTYISERMGTPQVDTWVKVVGMPDGNGGIDARRIKVVDPKAFEEIVGKVTSVSDDALAVGGILLQKSEDTLVMGTLAVDKMAKVLYTEGEDALVAAQIRMEDAIRMPTVTPPAWHTPKAFVHFSGVIESLPEGGLGTWVISGRNVEVTVNTWVDEHKGQARVGARVRVRGLLDEDGETVIALRITVEPSFAHPTPPRPYTFIQGPIESMPANGYVGDWMVGGRTVHVQPTTRMDTRWGQPAVGQNVAVWGYVNRDGSIDAVLVRVMRRWGMPTHTPMPPHPTHTPQPPHPTHTPMPPHPTHTPQPPHPTHTPQPPHPTHTPHPPHPTHTPQPPHFPYP